MTRRWVMDERPAAGPWTRLCTLHRCQSGQAIYVVVVFFFLLAGLLFLVINSGEKVNHKVQMQNAADAAAATAGGWYARGLNTISMCNVTETQLLSLIVLCDTLQTVTPHAKECIDNLVGNIGASKAGHDIPLDPNLSLWLVVGNAQSEKQIIGRFDDIVQAVPWPQYLQYDSGILWESVKLMDGFEHAMAKDTPLVAQREALDVARKDQADFAFALPLWPELPITKTGQFSDFKDPMSRGHLPRTNGQDGHVIGMFATVIPYRGYNGQVLGPWGYWREPFTTTQPMGLFDLSRFSVMFNIVSRMQLNMLFDSGADDRVALGEKEWEMDFDKAKKIPNNRIRRVWWETVSFDARFPNAEETPAFPVPPGGATPLHSVDRPVPHTYTNGTLDGQPPAGFTRATQSYEGADPREAVWYKVTRQRTNQNNPQYPQLGIFVSHPPVHPDGTPWLYTEAELHTYWRVELRRFNGLEMDTDTSLSRAFVGDANETIWPIMLDPATGFNTVSNVNNYFTLDGFAYRDGKVHYWPTSDTQTTGQSGLPGAQGFKNSNPIDQVIAYSQVRVYNRFSWDLFTQHWKVKLMRMENGQSSQVPQNTRWQWMKTEIQKSPNAALDSILTPERLKPVRDMLDGYDEQFVEEVTH